MRSPPTTCTGPAPSQTVLPPTNDCSRSSCSCLSAANSTRSDSPTRRSRDSNRWKAPDRSRPDPSFEIHPKHEESMENAIDRIMMTYDLLLNRSAAASAEARAKVTEYVTTLFEAGEKDMHRLTVCGLTYLRELDGTNDPVKAGYTGL